MTAFDHLTRRDVRVGLSQATPISRAARFIHQCIEWCLRERVNEAAKATHLHLFEPSNIWPSNYLHW